MSGATFLMDLQDKTILRSTTTGENSHLARLEFDNGISLGIKEASLPLRIGRSNTCDISIPSGHVSRQHCELYLVGGALCLKDTSTNGTTVNGKKLIQGSISISGKTTVVFADEIQITIIPGVPRTNVTEMRPDLRSKQERRQGERRQSERRQTNQLVTFERRSLPDRRVNERRASARK